MLTPIDPPTGFEDENDANQSNLAEDADDENNTASALSPDAMMVPPSDFRQANNSNMFNIPLSTTNDMNEIDPTTLALWRERERRQRTLRTFLTFLFLLLLMDGDNNDRNSNIYDDDNVEGHRRKHLRKRAKQHANQQTQAATLEASVFASRQEEDQTIHSLVVHNYRYTSLVERNHGHDIEQEVTWWSEQQLDQVKDEFAQEPISSRLDRAADNGGVPDSDHDRKVWHYPWNSTGFYRGEWKRSDNRGRIKERKGIREVPVDDASVKRKIEDVGSTNINNDSEKTVVSPIELEKTLDGLLKAKHESIGVYLLPKNALVNLRDDNNLTSSHWDEMTMDSSGKLHPGPTPTSSDDVTLTHSHGRVAFQLYSRLIPSMKELSLVEGFVKLYDSNSPGYSTRKDMLMRVKGILVHSIGRLSLVSHADIQRSALFIGETIQDDQQQRRRRLQEALGDVNANSNSATLAVIRNEALVLFETEKETSKSKPLLSTELENGKIAETPDEYDSTIVDAIKNNDKEAILSSSDTDKQPGSRSTSYKLLSPSRQPVVSDAVSLNKSRRVKETISDETWSDRVIPFPYVRDDAKESIRQLKTPAARRMPSREQLLEANAAACEFELNMDVEPVEMTVGDWRNLVLRRMKEAKKLDPSRDASDSEAENEPTHNDHVLLLSQKKARSRQLQDQALVMSLTGSIVSENCKFEAHINATALRTDWDATTGKVINYSFYMMLVCLSQILLLLRQLVHSQPQSTAVRVSLLCIGWQAVSDALACLGHIYLSLAMQPLFTAFASVAFFKLLIFCVIEMKYMSIIIQARNSSAGGQPSDVLRRQVAMLHLRFYVALFGAFLLLFYIGDKYRIPYMLILYSFWVPQIVLNVVTEAKTPMHKYYIYGMSITRLVSPLYMYGLKGNFMKEIYPDSPYDPVLCQLLIVWVAVQTAVLLAQGKYGARFMVPARFLPPKFDYSRPLPASMMPPGALEHMRNQQNDESTHTDVDGHDNRDQDGSGVTSARRDRHKTSQTTRNRMRGNRRNDNESTTMVIEEQSPTLPRSPSPTFTLDCSICYEAINVCSHHDYMLAPCDHLFHRECLVRWMDVKMECPICRTELPAL